MMSPDGFVQAYNVQVAVDRHQLLLIIRVLRHGLAHDQLQLAMENDKKVIQIKRS
jgi:hypothetical protein